MEQIQYQPGMSLGKQGDGIKEPVAVQLKIGRKGLGHDEKQREIRQELEIFGQKRRKLHQRLHGDYCSRIRQALNIRQILADFYRSQKSCFELDSRIGIAKTSSSGTEKNQILYFDY